MHVGRRIVIPIALAVGLLRLVATDLEPYTFPALADADATATQASTIESTGAQPTHLPTPTSVREAPSAGNLISRYLDDRFGQGAARSDWHVNIRSVTVRFGTAIVQTNLSDDPGDQPKLSAICQAVLGFLETAWGRQLEGLAVEVYDPNGRLLAQDRAQASTLGRTASQRP